MTGSLTSRAAAYRREMVDALVVNGSIRSSAVRAAFTEVARDDFVARFRDPEDVHRWIDAEDDPDARLRGVYQDEVLVVATRPAPDLVDADGAPTSSSSMPSVMAGMLEALDVRPGMRVLEIGTGTGYNTALLCTLAGAENVVSVELDPDLTAAARECLHNAGFHPTLHVGDGRNDVPDQPPFDRIIATASADHIPPDWITSLTVGGAIVADLRGSLGGGLVRVTKSGDDLVEGGFLGAPGAFMPLRARRDSPHRDGETWDRPLDMTNPALGLTSIDPARLDDPVLRLVVQCHFGGRRLRGFLPDRDAPTWSGHEHDGSWFTVDSEADDDGRRRVRQGGPQRLWDTVTVAVDAWERLGCPDITDLRVVARDHAALQHVQPYGAESAFRWPLPL